jgi:hypothetical protein
MQPLQDSERRRGIGHDSLGVNFITGQNEREETTPWQDTIVTKSAACASYEINYVTYITATYTRAKRRWHGAILGTSHVLIVLLVKAIRSVAITE